MELVLFAGLALVASISGLLVIIQRHALYSALFLIITMGSLAGLYILLEAHFVWAVQVLVYAGAIMVLFLFVIMLLGTQHLPATGVLPWQRPVAIGLAVLLAGEAVYLLLARGAIAGAIAQPIESFGSPQGVGRALFNQYLLPFEVTSVLLLVAMVGAIVITRRDKGGQ